MGNGADALLIDDTSSAPDSEHGTPPRLMVRIPSWKAKRVAEMGKQPRCPTSQPREQPTPALAAGHPSALPPADWLALGCCS